jgi:ABC-type antimicrobial peptide transport system permease subunit
VLRRGLLLTAIGLVAGLLLAVGLGQALGSLLFEVGPRDPATFAAVAAVLGLTALAACALPAWRAARVDPITALRTE